MPGIIRSFLRRKKGFTKHKTAPGFTRYRLASGFTLIELLIVISVLGVLSVGVVTALNVTSTVNKAKIAKAETFDASVLNSLSMNLVGEWKLDQETTIPGPPIMVKDTSGYGNNGTVTGATLTTDRKEQNNKAYSFDGNDNVQIADQEIFHFGVSPFTISVWINPNATTSQRQVILFKGSSNNDLYFALEYAKVRGWTATDSMAGPICDIFSGAISELDSNAEVPINAWTHVAFTRETNGTLRIYINGLRDNERTGCPLRDITNSGSIRIGMSSSSGFNGKIDDVRIFREALIAVKIQDIFNETKNNYLAAK